VTHFVDVLEEPQRRNYSPATSPDMMFASHSFTAGIGVRLLATSWELAVHHSVGPDGTMHAVEPRFDRAQRESA